MAEAHKRSNAEVSASPDFNKPFNHLQMRIFDDEVALGLTCSGQIATRARETEHAIVRHQN